MNTQTTKFVRRTTLHVEEYRKNFRQIDRDVIEVLKSEKARQVTTLMAVIYLSLIDAPSQYWEREGVLRFGGDVQGEKKYTAWQQLVQLLGCGNSTAKKALDWMHEQGVIGYFAGKNGYGIRIFINRAASSIGVRADQKNLRLLPVPVREAAAPRVGISSKDLNLEIQDTDNKSGARENCAERKFIAQEKLHQSDALLNLNNRLAETNGCELKADNLAENINLGNVVERLRRELEPCVRRAAIQAAAWEHDRTREWFEQKALPKAVRIAQKESYDVLRKYGFIGKTTAHSDVGRQIAPTASSAIEAIHGSPAYPAREKTEEEIRELAESCVALFELQGKPLEATLGELGANAGGWLSLEDLERIGELASQLFQDVRQRTKQS